MVFQNFIWGVMKPIYWAIYMGTSPLVQHSSYPQGQANLAADAGQLRVIPWAILLGFILPTVMASLPWPQLSTPERQQTWIALWLLFPIWVRLAQFALGLVIRGSDSSHAAMTRRLRRVYAVTIIESALVHISVIVYVVFPHLRPMAVIPPAGSKDTVTLASVFAPMAPWSTENATSLAEGFRTLLVYDWYYACGSTLLWAVVMSRNTGTTTSGAVAKAVAYSVLLGPAAAAVAMVWERDEKLLIKNMPVKS